MHGMPEKVCCGKTGAHFTSPLFYSFTHADVISIAGLAQDEAKRLYIEKVKELMNKYSGN